MKNKILAMEAAPAATPPNPKTAAIIATIRNITVQRSIKKVLGLKKFVCCSVPAVTCHIMLKISIAAQRILSEN